MCGLYVGGDCIYKFATKTFWRTMHEKVPMIKNVAMIKEVIMNKTRRWESFRQNRPPVSKTGILVSN